MCSHMESSRPVGDLLDLPDRGGVRSKLVVTPRGCN